MIYRLLSMKLIFVGNQMMDGGQRKRNAVRTVSRLNTQQRKTGLEHAQILWQTDIVSLHLSDISRAQQKHYIH